MRAPPTMYDAAIVCRKVVRNTGLPSTAPKSVSSARPVCGLKVAPTGFCIQELAARMNTAETIVPMAVR